MLLNANTSLLEIQCYIISRGVCCYLSSSECVRLVQRPYHEVAGVEDVGGRPDNALIYCTYHEGIQYRHERSLMISRRSTTS